MKEEIVWRGACLLSILEKADQIIILLLVL
jgi:hypothetical protein